ncbi:F0F1-type ATP synthase subunit beta [Pseudomonas aeruginosa]|uniref:F0F1-type ATP synthase subunit beta n=1 Tax=Pseudomonas aeruginosa TaxID=287 RepID=UPI000717A352|nr:F0F1-type ATP synthase subunit beta [Pseudomonas aeruginosa]KRU93161.1 F0F1-type ATP synthase subunit beta [Pseudomonas aeruginosa]KRV02763.1 F0F1-type ATP synthase subunit beta [Pseudomonas aeruginosa]
MEMEPMTCRPFTLCLALLGLLSLPAFAAGTADDLLALHQMRLATQKSLNAFFMYVGQEGDQRYASLIDSSAHTAQARLQRLDGVNGSESRRLPGQLREQWRDYAQDLDKLTGAVRNKGYSDLQPVADLARRNQQLMDLGGQLYRSLQRENAATVPTLTEQSREQSLLMQGIALDYASRNASVGASFFGGGEERPLDDLASRFSVNLLKLQQAPQNDEEIARALRSVAIKWHYIEKSLRNYNQNSVPFLVNKNADRIIDGLEKVAALYAARNQ